MHSFKIDSGHRPPMIVDSLYHFRYCLQVQFFVTASFQAYVGDVRNISRPSVCKILDMTLCLLEPTNEQSTLSSRDLARNLNGFNLIANLPNSAVCIDGIRIRFIFTSVDHISQVNCKNHLK